MSKILLTGFGDWAGSSANPAKAVAKALNGMTIADASVSGHIAPSVFEEMIPSVTAEIDRLLPDIVISMGEFGGRGLLTVERLAQNYIDAKRYGIADEAGVQPQETIVPGGPAAYYATLPIRAMVKAMRAAGVPADISDTAGTFGCNLLMYGVLHYIAVNNLPIRAGWVHLPSIPATAALEENIGMPSMSIETQITGLRAGIVAAVEHERDIGDPVKSNWQF
ncbi:MAG: pyroglutamyl-peptidase I [Chromatiaceae bacterium]|jgi:pyroglutamyl-peptidase|nr:pyroglutamyl-peptidase I [Chromatiaceae bacterium]